MSETTTLAVTYQPLAALEPYARNARRHSPTQIKKLKASLMEFGWANPMLVAERQMIAGHARLAAALELMAEGKVIPHVADTKTGPTIDLSHLTPAQRRGYILADNRLAEEAIWDLDLLRLEFTDLADGFDLAVTGFDAAEMDSIMHGWAPDMTHPNRIEAELSELEALIRIRCLQRDRDDIIKRVTAALAGIGHVTIA